MILKGTKTEEISVDATKIQEQINELSVKIDNLPSYSFDGVFGSNSLKNSFLPK